MSMSSPTSAGPLWSPNVNASSPEPRRSPPSAITYAAPRPSGYSTPPQSPTWTPQLRVSPAFSARVANRPSIADALPPSDAPCCSCMMDGDTTPTAPNPCMAANMDAAGPGFARRILWRTAQALPAPTGELRLGAGCGIRLPCPPGFSPPHFGFTGFNFTNLGL